MNHLPGYKYKDHSKIFREVFEEGKYLSPDKWTPLVEDEVGRKFAWGCFHPAHAVKRTETSTAIAKIMAATPGKNPESATQLSQFIGVFPEFKELAFDTLMPHANMIDVSFFEAIKDYLIGDRIVKAAVSLSSLIAIIEFSKFVGGAYLEKNFAEFCVPWGKMIKEEGGFYDEGLVSILPQACLPQLLKIRPTRNYAAWLFYISILRSWREDIPDDLEAAAILRLDRMIEKDQTSYHIKKIVFNHPISVFSKLLGEKLIRILQFLNRFIDQSNEERRPTLITNLPSDEDFRARAVDLLLSQDESMTDLYKSGLEALRELRSKLQYGANAKKMAVSIMDNLGDAEAALGQIIARARMVNDEELWKVIPGAFLLREVGSGSFASEHSACKLLQVLRRHFPEPAQSHNG